MGEAVRPDAVFPPAGADQSRSVPRGTDLGVVLLPVVGGPLHGTRCAARGLPPAGYQLAHVGLDDPFDDDLVHVLLVWLPVDPDGALEGHGWLVAFGGLVGAMAGLYR